MSNSTDPTTAPRLVAVSNTLGEISYDDSLGDWTITGTTNQEHPWTVRFESSEALSKALLFLIRGYLNGRTSGNDKTEETRIEILAAQTEMLSSGNTTAKRTGDKILSRAKQIAGRAIDEIPGGKDLVKDARRLAVERYLKKYPETLDLARQQIADEQAQKEEGKQTLADLLGDDFEV